MFKRYLKLREKQIISSGPAADPDLRIGGWGGGVIQTLRLGGGRVSIFFSTLRTSVWSKNKGGGPPGPSPGSATGGIKGTLASPHSLPPPFEKTGSCSVRIVFLQTKSALSKRGLIEPIINMTWALKLTSLPTKNGENTKERGEYLASQA